MIDVRYHRGLELPEHGLWLDPWDERPLAFVSHAHSDHIAEHQEIIASTRTARLMQARLPGARRERLLEFGESAEVNGGRITLLPAGHIFGSAQIHLESDAGSLLYTGDFKLRHGLSAEPAEWRHAETLIMETTYGLPRYRMPPTEDVMAQMVEFCRETLEEGGVPVLLGYSLGKSQEILCALLKAGFTPMLHGAVWRMTEIYRQLESDFPTGYVRYTAGEVQGKVLVCPPSANRSPMITRIKQRRSAVLTGWALDPGAMYRYQVDAAFPLSDHADYPDLIRYVELVQPKRVLTLHGFASAFAADLRARGVEAWALSEANQLELTLPQDQRISVSFTGNGSGEEERDISSRGAIPSADGASSEFGVMAALGERIAATSSKLKKIELLSDYLRSLDETQLPIAATYLTGRAFAQSDPRILNVGWAAIKRAVLAVTKVSHPQFYAVANRHSDAGKTAQELLTGRTAPRPLGLKESREFFEELQRARGPSQKGAILERQIAHLSALEGGYIVRILTGDLRIGLKEGLVEEAIAAAFAVESDAVREANMLVGDIGEAALLASRNALVEARLRLFRPIKCMLASPEPSAAAAWARIATAEAWAEDKFDGIRAQLHVGNGRVEIFTRDLRCATEQFADLVRLARELRREVVLDGEILAYDAGRKLTFFDLQKRLGRKTTDDLFEAQSAIPVIYQAFDVLYLGGRTLLREPLSERRRLLEELTLPGTFHVAPITAVASAHEIESAFQAARRRGNEGLMLKSATSTYTPGRRGLAWIKLKKELATLDVVVVGAEYGNGRRSQVLSDYTFAVRDDASGALLTIGKAYSGLTDSEIEELTEHFLQTTTVDHGRYREVQPEIVLEIAFDSVQPSNRHSSGLALRFPRIKAIRRDKTPAEIDPLSYARNLAGIEMLPTS